MSQADNTGLYIRNVEAPATIRLILWTVWMLSGLIVLILLVAIITTLFEKPIYSSFNNEQRVGTNQYASFADVTDLMKDNKTCDEVNDTNKQIYNREAYSNPRSADNEKDKMKEQFGYPLVNFEQRVGSFGYDSLTDDMPPKGENKTRVEVQDIIEQIHNRKGYSDPTGTALDEEDTSEELITKKSRRRPLKPIGKDFNLNKSYVIKHPNGTLTYVFPTNYSTVRPSSLPDHTDPPAQFNDDYPVELIDKIMNISRALFEGAFGDDIVIPNGDALNRRSDAPDEPFLCESSERLTHPQEGQTRSNSKVWIVNTKDYKQGVRVETCRYPGKPCRYCDFDTICKQVYHYRTLVAVDKNTKKLYKEQILLHSSCKCAKL